MARKPYYRPTVKKRFHTVRAVASVLSQYLMLSLLAKNVILFFRLFKKEKKRDKE